MPHAIQIRNLFSDFCASLLLSKMCKWSAYFLILLRALNNLVQQFLFPTFQPTSAQWERAFPWTGYARYRGRQRPYTEEKECLDFFQEIGWLSSHTLIVFYFASATTGTNFLKILDSVFPRTTAATRLSTINVDREKWFLGPRLLNTSCLQNW